jgi:3-isopropylmalate/(R)-2-methylmalate dehydratase large subunit
MSIEMGARGGMIAPDQTTFDYINGKDKAPKGEVLGEITGLLENIENRMQGLPLILNIHLMPPDIEPMITFGTNPGMGIGILEAYPCNR